jgi:hypothetical protein
VCGALFNPMAAGGWRMVDGRCQGGDGLQSSLGIQMRQSRFGPWSPTALSNTYQNAYPHPPLSPSQCPVNLKIVIVHLPEARQLGVSETNDTASIALALLASPTMTSFRECPYSRSHPNSGSLNPPSILPASGSIPLLGKRGQRAAQPVAGGVSINC